ncbi:DUF2281 domain-containing protein [Chroococcidiopsis sp. CCALA 051]|uniref:DUF2281 domain-containing protein n=1 Tax=Chroococcidiopsis sp. CCALA 051 TaxID=869949 RepID=UPI000D0C9818|nr:DUF2281 domain-containing protein [Chroococcidiopsis sp. CCALA 051]MBE9017538.1 DUF2281 domain-containing protein [Chroococcidiopsidales cyanobacterium LEGE 13417]PSM49454.1 DUF2281 domain-containing protein [Chroococcidiopsis sp. CCALA 051]
MNTKEQIVQEIDSLSEPQLQEALELIRTLKQKPTLEGKAFKAYLETEEKWSGVYRRLADS